MPRVSQALRERIYGIASAAYDNNQPHSRGISAVVDEVIEALQPELDHVWLRRENEQLREVLAIPRIEHVGKNIAELNEAERHRLVINGFQAMNGVLRRQVKIGKDKIAKLTNALQEIAGEPCIWAAMNVVNCADSARPEPCPVCRARAVLAALTTQESP